MVAEKTGAGQGGSGSGGGSGLGMMSGEAWGLESGSGGGRGVGIIMGTDSSGSTRRRVSREDGLRLSV